MNLQPDHTSFFMQIISLKNNKLDGFQFYGILSKKWDLMINEAELLNQKVELKNSVSSNNTLQTRWRGI